MKFVYSLLDKGMYNINVNMKNWFFFFINMNVVQVCMSYVEYYLLK